MAARTPITIPAFAPTSLPSELLSGVAVGVADGVAAEEIAASEASDVAALGAATARELPRLCDPVGARDSGRFVLEVVGSGVLDAASRASSLLDGLGVGVL